MSHNGAESLCQNGAVTDDQNGVRTEIEEGDKDKVELFKALIREGKSVNKAMRESGLSTYKYQKYYDAIWSDPEMAEFKPQPLFPSNPTGSDSAGDERNQSGETIHQKSEHKGQPPEAGRLEEALKNIEVDKPPSITPSEALNALKWYQREFRRVFGGSLPVAIGVRPPAQQGKPPEAAVAGYSLETSLEKVKAAEEEAKTVLERLGYKVVKAGTPVTLEEAKKLVEEMGYELVDTRLPREEVEKMLEEARLKWQQEHDMELETRLEEAKIGAAERVVTKAIDKVMEPFTYFLKKWFEETVETRVASVQTASEDTLEMPGFTENPHNAQKNMNAVAQSLRLARYTRERPSPSESEAEEGE